MPSELGGLAKRTKNKIGSVGNAALPNREARIEREEKTKIAALPNREARIEREEKTKIEENKNRVNVEFSRLGHQRNATW
ncbi:hypothetical protein QE152_g6001 [Popillia japonica]|uniref:Uncharacterized protein n=1 Tax=Popillia japonica TaxID=7064 RepID=A0AAW1MJW9_POPJA